MSSRIKSHFKGDPLRISIRVSVWVRERVKLKSTFPLSTFTMILYFPVYHILVPLLLRISLRKENAISSCSETCPSPSLTDALPNQNEKVFIFFVFIDFRNPLQGFNLNMGQPYPFNYCLHVKCLTQEQSV